MDSSPPSWGGCLKKILLASGGTDWAIDFQCNGIAKALKDKYEFIPLYDTKHKIAPPCDLAYYASYIHYHGQTPPEKSVCGIVGIHERHIYDVVNKVRNCLAITYPAMYMMDVFKHFFHDESKMYYAPYGIDTKLFCPKPRAENKVFTIGWAGNHVRTWKRFKELQALIGKIDNVVFKTQLKDKKIPYEKMPEFYQSLDLYVCYSIEEGFGYPVLEAAACGVPIVTTPVGCGYDFGDSVLTATTSEEFTRKVNAFRDNKALCKEFSEKSRAISLYFDWDAVKSWYDVIFQRSLR